MENNLDFKNIENWHNLRKLYLSNDKQSWQLADSILTEANNGAYRNQILALLKSIPDERSKLDLEHSSWSHIMESEIITGTRESVQMLADIYIEYLKDILFTDGMFRNFNFKLIYNGRQE